MSGSFTDEQIKRYSRQIILPEVGGKGQKKLLASRVLVLGAGGLGSPAIAYLAAAGVGTLGIIDHDLVEVSNLHEADHPRRQYRSFQSEIGTRLCAES